MSKKLWLFITLLTGVNSLLSLVLLTIQAPLNQWTRLSLFLYQVLATAVFWALYLFDDEKRKESDERCLRK